MGVGDDLGGIERLPDGLDHFRFVAGEGRNRAGVFFRCFDALILHRRQAARKDRFSDQRQRNAFVQCSDTCPLAGALLACGVENLLDDGLTVCIVICQNVAGDFN